MAMDLQTCSRARLCVIRASTASFSLVLSAAESTAAPSVRHLRLKKKIAATFPTAAAAAEAGFRPCLRCHPECFPGTPAWLGTSNTVSRALRLIGESGLEDGGIENLAERVGVGSRHLRRLFIHHLGAPPSAVAQTRRLHFAKKLIDETRLHFGEIALASGFGCVRRFNAAIKKSYKRTPSHIRRLTRQTEIQPENEYAFHLRFRPPYHWKGMLEFLAARATPGVELVDQNSYRRSIFLNGHQGHFEVSLDDDDDRQLIVRVQIGDPRSLFVIVERVRAMFDLNADWAAIARSLGSDPQLAASLRAQPGLRVPGSWNGFELAVRAILGQQITVKGATNLAGRLAKSFGQPLASANGLTHLFPTPEVLAEAKLTNVGLTEKRAQTIRSLARAVSDGIISFDRVIDSESFLNRLCEIPGIGNWTAQYVAMRALGEPDAFPQVISVCCARLI